MEHDPAWFAAARREMRRIRSVLGAVAVEVHHIGSTSIPGILAKPVIDLCLEVSGLSELDGQEAAMGALGYEALGEYGIPRRRFFLRNDEAGVRTHHVHAFAAGDSEVRRHVAFRDYMIAHPAAARAYGSLKGELLREHPSDIEAYMDGKDSFIKEHQRKALECAEQRPVLRLSTR